MLPMALGAICFRDEGTEAQGGQTRLHSHTSQGGDLAGAGSHFYRPIIPLDSTGDRPTEVWRRTEINISVDVILGGLPGWPSQPREVDEDIGVPLVYFWNLVPL